MRTLTLLTLLTLAAAPVACSDAQLSLIEREDSGMAADAPPDVVRPSDVAPDPLVCEPAGDAVCAPSACAPVCHAREGGAIAGTPCTVSYSSAPARWDDCTAGNVCLTDDFGASHCFALCQNVNGCPGRPCAARKLSGATTIRVCDPPYRNCSSASEPCCDPLAQDSCGPGKYCYLVRPQPGSEDSWTVCDYVTGGASVGEPCTTSSDCVQRLACVLPTPSSPAGECRQVCNPAVADPCATGTCVPYAKQWGICSG